MYLYHVKIELAPGRVESIILEDETSFRAGKTVEEGLKQDGVDMSGNWKYICSHRVSKAAAFREIDKGARCWATI